MQLLKKPGGTFWQIQRDVNTVLYIIYLMLQVRKYKQLIKADVDLPCPTTVFPRKIKAKFWRLNKVHYGLCENGEYVTIHDNFS